MRVGDPVRLRPDSPLRDRLKPFADEVGWIVDTFQDDDDDGLRIAVAYPDQLYGWLAPLSAEDFVVDAGRSDAPFWRPWRRGAISSTGPRCWSRSSARSALTGAATG